MEDDDEFGDLYTDVLRPFASTSSSTDAPQPHGASPVPPPLLHRPIDLSLKSDENEILFGNPRSNSPAPNRPSDQTLAPRPTELDSAPNLIVRDERVDDLAGRSGVSDGGRVELPKRAPPEDVKFDIEEGNTGIFDAGSEPIIPGLSGAPAANPEASTADNDWDSDSEDDLQIVLNDSNHGPMAMERGAIGGEEEDDDDDEDGDPLVIVADGELNQELEAQEWGEDAAGQAVGADGERKETGEAGKVGGGGGGAAGVVAPKIGYSSHGYHPFHSQFKVSVFYAAVT